MVQKQAQAQLQHITATQLLRGPLVRAHILLNNFAVILPKGPSGPLLYLHYHVKYIHGY